MPSRAFGCDQSRSHTAEAQLEEWPREPCEGSSIGRAAGLMSPWMQVRTLSLALDTITVAASIWSMSPATQHRLYLTEGSVLV